MQFAQMQLRYGKEAVGGITQYWITSFTLLRSPHTMSLVLHFFLSFPKLLLSQNQGVNIF